MVLRVTLFDGQRQATHFLAHLDAKRAGAELVERQALANLVDSGLFGGCALHASRLGQTLFEEHDGAEHDAQGSEECTDDGFHKDLNNSKVDGEKEASRAITAGAPSSGP
jgi:hypothetical protein